MNIWYLSAHDQPEGHSARTYDYCVKFVQRGHRVTMFTNSYCHFTHCERLTEPVPWKIEMFDGVRVVWLKTVPYQGNGWGRGVNMLTNMVRSLQAACALKEKPDVVLGPSVPLFTALAAHMIAWMKKAAFVFEVRDIWPQALVDLGYITKSNPLFIIFRAVERYLYRKADQISAVLPLTYKHVENSGGDPSKVTWISNGIHLDRFEKLPEYGGGRPDRLTLLYVGGFSVSHAVQTIIEAAALIESDLGDACRFILVGAGSERAGCEARARELGLRNVEFRNPIPKSEVPDVLAEADILMVSVKDVPIYRYGINFNKVFDYLAAGRPILFACNAPNDPVREFGAGISVPPENPKQMAKAIRTFFSLTPSERCALGANGRRYAQKELDIDILAQRFEVLLLDAVKCAESRRAS